MKTLMSLGAAGLLVLSGCSTDRHLLHGYTDSRRMVSPEKSSGEGRRCVDPVCGGNCSQAGSWHSRHRGIGYVFDSEACKACFDSDPELYCRR